MLANEHLLGLHPKGISRIDESFPASVHRKGGLERVCNGEDTSCSFLDAHHLIV